MRDLHEFCPSRDAFLGFGAAVVGGGLAGKIEEEALAIHAGMAQGGEGLDEAEEGLGLLLEGLDQGGRVDGSEDLGDTHGGDLGGGFVDFAVIVFMHDVEEELGLGLGIFPVLLFGEPDEVAGPLPAGEVIFVQARSKGPEPEDDLVIGDALAEELVDGVADLGGKLGDFVAGEAGESGEVAWDRGGGGGGSGCRGRGLGDRPSFWE